MASSPPPPSGHPASYSAPPTPPPPAVQPSRNWWQKKRYAIPAGLFGFLFLSIVGLAAIGSTVEPEPEDTPAALALADPGDLQVEGDAASTSSIEPPVTTTQAPETTTTSSTSTAAPTTSAAPTTTTQAPTTTAAPETVSYECGGEILELPAGDDSDLDALCDNLQQLVWVDGINTQLPVIAEWARATDTWDAYEEAGRGMCAWAADIDTESEFGLQLAVMWNILDEATQFSFDNDIENFALFSGISIGAFCPQHLPG